MTSNTPRVTTDNLAPKTNRLFLVLSLFTPSDLKQLSKFIRSPYFNQSKTLVQLLDEFTTLIQKERPGFVKEKIWQKLFPDKEYNDTNFRKYCSDLLELVEHFMAIDTYITDTKRIQLDKIDFLSSRKVEPLYKTVVHDQEKYYTDKSYLRASDYYNMYAFENKYNRLMNFDVRIDANLNLDKISSNLDLFFLIEKLRLYYNTLTNNRFMSAEFDINDIESVLKLCEKYDLNEHPELAIYFYSYQTSTNHENIEYYYKLKSTLEKCATYIPKDEASELFDTALNYCIARVNRGEKLFLQEYFDMFNIAISNGVFIVNGEIAARRFTNIVIMALRLGKTDWAYKFVNEKKYLLPLETRTNTFNFNMARVHLYRKEYSKVLDFIRDVEYDDIFINLISKVMITISYYELDEYDALDSFIETYRTFINRQKDVSNDIKNGYLNLLGFVRRLMRLKSNDPATINKLKEDIANAKATTVNQEWLLEKVEEVR